MIKAIRSCLIEREITNAIAKRLLDGTIRDNTTVTIDTHDGAFTFATA